ncbi:MAG: hypothetical protein CMM25_06325 [Rhodospirillaceae bacterium]|nr:hypothetical protein [Rhodospirillaceae bacterium]
MTQPAIVGVKRHYVTIGNRQIHYRRCGSGPLLIVLHALPKSSADFVELMTSFKHKFTVIAPDFAGYGNSVALDTKPLDITPYCDDLNFFMDALGVNTALFYGEQFGAAVILQFAVTHTSRVKAIATWDLDKRYDGKQDSLFENHYPEFKPHWSGSHLSWLWAFIREQNFFDPWYNPGLSSRVDSDMHATELLNKSAIEFLTGGRNGEGYEIGLSAANTFSIRTVLEQLSCSAILIARLRKNVDDPWIGLNSCSSNICLSSEREYNGGRISALEFLSNFSINESIPAPPKVRPIKGRLTCDFADVDGGQVHFQYNIDAQTEPLLVQHDAASSIGTVKSISEYFIGKRTVYAFDMPGSGESDQIIQPDGITVQNYAEVLKQALEFLHLSEIDFYGMWGGGFVGLELSLMHEKQVRRLIMSNVFQHTGDLKDQMLTHYTPNISPTWHGGHLLQCWHQMRDQGIYYPWFDNTRSGIIWRPPYLSTDMVHGRVCSLLKAGNMYQTAYCAHFNYPTYEKLGRAKIPTLLATTSWDPNNPDTLAAFNSSSNCSFEYLHDDMQKWGDTFLPFLQM